MIRIFDNKLMSSLRLIDVDGIINEIRLKHTHSIVREKFGDEAARIFLLLVEKKQLQETSISDFALVAKKTARDKLYCMMRQNFVHLQVFSI